MPARLFLIRTAHSSDLSLAPLCPGRHARPLDCLPSVCARPTLKAIANLSTSSQTVQPFSRMGSPSIPPSLVASDVSPFSSVSASPLQTASSGFYQQCPFRPLHRDIWRIGRSRSRSDSRSRHHAFGREYIGANAMTIDRDQSGAGTIEASSSRNNLFSTSWSPQVPTPSPPPRDALRGRRPLTASSSTPFLASISTDRNWSDLAATATTTRGSSNGSPRTASFFDTAIPSPLPAPKIGPQPHLDHLATASIAVSPLNLSRTSSYHKPLSLSVYRDPDKGIDHLEDDELSPLHKSPSIPSANAADAWQPPLPPTLRDVDMRFFARSTYLLGVGRYAKVYLASFKRDDEPIWELCAAKLMASDRHAQTMGLREAFFLNRLTGAPKGNTSPTGESQDSKKGAVYVVKLIAVKEEADRRPSSGTGTHTRSSSAVTDSKPLSRKRSSTFGIKGEEPQLSSFPSLPELAQTLKDPVAPSFSRLVLLLEHAPLGTLDRFLRTSPSMVGKALWGRWAREGAEALHWIHHQGVVHADVKPGNMLVGRLQPGNIFR